MHKPLLRLTSLRGLCSGIICTTMVMAILQLVADRVDGAVPPPPRDRREVDAVMAQAPKAPAASQLRPLHIVLVANRKDHGKNEHDYPRWMACWKVLLGGKAAGSEPVNLFGPAADLSQGPAAGAAGVTVETAKDWPSAEQFAKADLIVGFFGTGGIWSETKLGNLQAFLARGGGFVALHSAIIAEKPRAKRLAESIGLAWESGYTLFREGPLDLKIVARDNPICVGLPEQIHFEDEAYWPLVGDASKISLLATANEKEMGKGPLHAEPMFWTCTAGKGRVYSCVLGHNSWTFDDPYFRILVLRGMAWAVGESPYRFDPLVLCGARVSDQKYVATAAPAPNRAAPVAPNPQDPNLLLWLDASDKSTLTIDQDRHVSAWSNKAAKISRKLTSAGSQRPRYVTRGIAGGPSIRFDGKDDVLRDAAFGQSVKTWTVVLVTAPRSNAGGNHRGLLSANKPGQPDFVSGFNIDLGPSPSEEFSTLSLESAKGQLGTVNLRANAAPFGDVQIIVLSTGKSLSRLWVNGVEEENRGASDAVMTMDELRLGARYFLGSERGYFHGDVAEVLLYDHALSDAKRASLSAHLLKKYARGIKTPITYSAANVWEYLPKYDFGASRRPLESIDETIRNARPGDEARKSLESHLIAVLSDASATVAAKDFACSRLSIVGTAASVPALAKLLSDEKLSHPACIALERIPGPAAEEALAKALGSVQGKLRVGLIYAVGNRRIQAAEAQLIDILRGADALAAEGAAKSLGKLAGPTAAEALVAAIDAHVTPHVDASLRDAIADSCLKCAERLTSANKQAEALAIYQKILAKEVSGQAKVAATRGTIVIQGAAAAPLLFEQLTSADAKRQTMALLLVRTLPGGDFTKAVASQLGTLPADKQADVLAALGDRNDPQAIPAILAGLKSDQPAVRLAAVQALGHVGDASVVPALLAAATGSEKEIAEAAANSLATIPGGSLDAVLLESLNFRLVASDAPPSAAQREKEFRVLIDVLGRRGYGPATPSLIACAHLPQPAIRLAAIQASGKTVPVSDLATLVGLLIDAQNPREATAAETAIATVSTRSDENAAVQGALVARLGRAGIPAKLALIRALGRLGGPKALEAVQAAAGDANAEIQDAAIRALCDWPDAGVADELLKLVQQSKSEKYRLLALRGYIRIAGLATLPREQRLAMCREALRVANRDDQRQAILGVLSHMASADALALVLPLLDAESSKEEAGVAAVAIGETLAASQPAAVKAAMDKVLKTVKDAEVLRRATELQAKAR